MKRPPLNTRHADAIAVFPPHGDWCETCDGPIWRFEQLPGEESCCWYCKVCEVIESRVDGEGVLRHAPATDWVGRKAEANATGTVRDEWSDEECAFMEAAQRRGSRGAIAASEMTGLERVGHTSREWAETIERITHHGQCIHVDSMGCHVLVVEADEPTPVGGLLDGLGITIGATGEPLTVAELEQSTYCLYWSDE